MKKHLQNTAKHSQNTRKTVTKRSLQNIVAKRKKRTQNAQNVTKRLQSQYTAAIRIARIRFFFPKIRYTYICRE